MDMEALNTDIHTIVKAMDDVLEENIPNHALQEQRDMALKYRNLGIGIMGLADMFVKLSVTYGSEESIKFTRNLMKTIFRQAVFASAENGMNKGNFPGYTDKVWDAEIMHMAFNEDELNRLRIKGCLRNCSLLSVAPTGSIGTMLNISTGVEPFFMLQFNRKTESLNKTETNYTVNIKALDEYHKVTGNNDIPSYFVTSAQINWLNRVRVQAALQDFTDTAISSTINLPKDTTPIIIEQIYYEAWKHGLKGITVYVEGSRDPILSSLDAKPKEIQDTKAPKRPKILPAKYYPITVKGESFIIMVGLLDDKPYELFAFKNTDNLVCKEHDGYIIKVSKNHYSFKSDCCTIDKIEVDAIEARTSIYISMLLRHGVDIKYIIKTAKKVNTNITSFTSAICRVLSKYLPKEQLEEVCPNCGGKLIRETGCIHCTQCEYSKCE